VESKKTMRIPRHHHIQTKSYLKNFARNGKVCVYDLKKKEVRKNQSTIKTGRIRDFYNTSIDQLISNNEYLSAPIIEKLRSNLNSLSISSQE
jgi:hypothetical protein